MDLPRFFCWTRFGTEAGQPIEQILERKEQERIVNNGLFLWGIGNSLTPSMIELYGDFLKSLDTSSSSVYETYSLSSPLAASRRMRLSSSLVVAFLT